MSPEDLELVTRSIAPVAGVLAEHEQRQLEPHAATQEVHNAARTSLQAEIADARQRGLDAASFDAAMVERSRRR